MECGFSDIFVPYLFHRSRNNRRDKLRSKFWREKNVQKTTFEAAEMMLGPWNQHYNLYERLDTTHLVDYMSVRIRSGHRNIKVFP